MMNPSDSLVDWVWTSNYFRRAASPVDVENRGIEALARWRSERLSLLASYAWLDKDPVYLTPGGLGSFYVLNFARQRITVGTEWQILRNLQLALDAAWREQEPNERRVGGRFPLMISLGLRWRPLSGFDWELNLLVDDLTDEAFQEFPGTPGYGRHASLRSVHRW